MTDAFVHITVDAGTVKHAAREVAEVDGVSSVHVVTGEWDVVAQLDLDDREDLPRVVGEEIQDCPPVAGTLTSVAFEP